MVEIDKKKCNGCGRCVKDCVAKNLYLKDNIGEVFGRCFLCGHCVAICPENAVNIPELDMMDVEECDKGQAKIEANALLRAIKFRRSIRNYKQQPVEQEKIEAMLTAGRYTATAKNTQGCRFIVVQKEIDTLKEMIWNRIGEVLSMPHEEVPAWANLFRGFYSRKNEQAGEDFLFRNAPAVLFIASDYSLDAGLAAQNMELMAVALGLGVLYNGYLLRAAEENMKVQEWLGAETKPLTACFLLGYPEVSYIRTAPRRKGDFIYKDF